MAEFSPWTVRAKNFRGLSHVEWSPDGVCLLVGPNGSGKTTILRALQFLATTYKRGVDEALRLEGPTHLRYLDAPSDAMVQIGIQYGELDWQLEIPIEGGGINRLIGETLRRNGDIVFETQPFENAATILGYGKRGDRPEYCGPKFLWEIECLEWLQALNDLLSNTRLYYSYWLNAVKKPFDETQYGLAHYLHPSGGNIWAVLSNWKMAPRKYRGQFEWVLEKIHDAFPELIRDIEFDRIDTTLSARFYPANAANDKDSLPVYLAADGLLTGLLHLTAVAGANDGAILAFDEMENQLHPHAIRAILKAMRERADERHLTIVLTTHSPTVMNEFKGAEDQFFILESGHHEGPLPIALSEAYNSDWFAHFSLGDLYDREQISKPTSRG